MPDVLEFSILDNPIRAWLLSATIVVGTLLVLVLLRIFLRRKLSRAKETATDIDDFFLHAVNRTWIGLLFFPVLYFSLRALELPVRAEAILKTAAIAAFFFQVGMWLAGLIDFWLMRNRKLRLESDPATVTTLSAFGIVVKVVLWCVLILAALDNLGFEVKTLLAGLGIGGIAVALALQNVLGDLFASLTIVIDKPFVIGDFIIVADNPGTVERIGLKTTRLRALSGEQLIFSNNDLLQNRIRNFKRMRERRVLFRFGVLYQTPTATLAKIPQIVREIIGEIEGARFDRAHFQGFGDSSLDFEAVYYVLSPDYNTYMDIQQAINLELFRRLQEVNVGFAYPTRTVYLAGETGLTSESQAS